MSDNGNGQPIRIPGRDALVRSLPKRFYREVAVGPAEGGGHCVQLDGRTALTPGKSPLAVPTARLAEALAAEWSAQAGVIDPAAMPLTRLVNTAIDGVAGRETEVAADIVKYAGSDLLCYRADFPEGLVARQRALWDPLLAWAGERYGARLAVVTGLMPVAQPPVATAGLADAVSGLETWALAPLHVMTTLMGSAVMALAVVDGRLGAEAAWEAAHVDEDWQIAEWGLDAEAAGRRARRWLEMQAAARMVALLGG
jgi:chaperone required for assembly of F1-ATPase